MRTKILFFSILIFFFHSILGYTETIRGVNYDPVHSLGFASAVGLDDKPAMQNAILKDLDQLAALQNQGFANIRHIKTFFTVYSSLGQNANRQEVNIADVVNNWNAQHPANAIQLALGVYEFRVGVDGCTSEKMCDDWTQVQVQAAIQSANHYPNLVDKIIVGNEDADDGALSARIVKDIENIKNHLNNKIIKVGTAQVANVVSQMFSSRKNINIKNAADFVGTNVYPFWGGVPYGNAPYKNSPAKENFAKYWQDLNTIKGTYEVIETEEGWPSAGGANGGAVPNPDFAFDYLHYWYYRPAPIATVSYLFALFDKLPGQGTESHWGIFSADRYASLLGAPNKPNDHSKPLNPTHALVNFHNIIGEGGGIPRVAAVNACTEDWNPQTKSQGKCYPIYGYYHTGDIAAQGNKRFMIDTSASHYKSLLVIFYGDNGEAPRLCYINKNVLMHMTNKTQVTLQWKTADGAVSCKVSR